MRLHFYNFVAIVRRHCSPLSLSAGPLLSHAPARRNLTFISELLFTFLVSVVFVVLNPWRPRDRKASTYTMHADAAPASRPTSRQGDWKPSVLNGRTNNHDGTGPWLNTCTLCDLYLVLSSGYIITVLLQFNCYMISEEQDLHVAV